MARNFGLDFIERAGEFAHAKLLLTRNQQRNSRPGGIRKGFTNSVWSEHELFTGGLDIRESIYMKIRICKPSQ
jgi:hypothetical protein